MIFRSKRKLSDEERIKTKEALKDDAKEGIIVLPDYIEVVGNNDYQVWSKGEYIKYILTKGGARSGTLDIKWKKVSKGYNFIIAIYREEIKDYDLLSVEYFNRLFGENNKEETDRILTIKEIKKKIIDNAFRKQKDVKEDM